MVNQADEPLRKITLNLYDTDVAWLKVIFGNDKYTVKIRDLVREYTRAMKDQEHDRPEHY